MIKIFVVLLDDYISPVRILPTREEAEEYVKTHKQYAGHYVIDEYVINDGGEHEN